MGGVRQPASVPDEFVERVTRWALGRRDPVSVILFGSRARGDYGPESDWDFALVYEGEFPSLDDLPSTLEGRDIDWAPIERSRATRRLNVCGVPHAVAADGRCLHGLPLPTPERKDMNCSAAWDNLFEAHNAMRAGLRDLTAHWLLPPKWRRPYNASVSTRSALAGELLCKAALSIRGVEPRRSHSVSELCGDLERDFPADPLLPLLRGCDGLTEAAHVNVYADLEFPREEIGVSARRLAGVLRAFGEVWAAVCDLSSTNEGRDAMGSLVAEGDGLREEVRRLCSGDCPRGVLRQVQAGLGAWPERSELWERLLAGTPARSREQAGRATASDNC